MHRDFPAPLLHKRRRKNHEKKQGVPQPASTAAGVTCGEVKEENNDQRFCLSITLSDGNASTVLA